MLVEMQPGKPASSEKSSNVIANMECEEEELSPAQIAAYTRPENDYQSLWTSLQKKLRLNGISEIPEPLYLTQFPKFVPNLGFYIDPSQIKKSQNVAGQSMAPTITSHPSIPTGNPANVIVPSPNTHASSVPKVGTGSILANTIIVPIGSKPSMSISRGRSRSRGNYSRVSTVPSSSMVNTSISPGVNRKPDVISKSQPVNQVGSNIRPAEKAYPSLVVVARPTLQIKKMTPQEMKSACQERSLVDGRVKQVLMYTPNKFTEWLLQQGLLRSEQCCSTHVDSEMKPVKLKLGMYSDSSKYPHSGGYVWLSECCPKHTISVFSGSIFEGAPYPPNVLLKLMYHWACQTSMMNIVAWVKVNSLFIKTFFTSLRAVCTAALHEKSEKLGGDDVKVEIGVISLGTTTADGGGRTVKIEVLGIMESESKLIRLRAVEPDPDSKKKFKAVLAPMEQWVHKNSVILTDFTVDKSTLQSMGFKNIIQASTLDPNKKLQKNSNINIMDYLKKVVPRMFQNTLAFLSRQMIQQFLDELVWRERWGFVSAKAFDSLIEHLAEQTKLETGNFLLPRLQRIALNPFKNWNYSNWKINCAADETMDLSELESTSSKLQKVTETAASTSACRLVRKRPAVDPQPVLGKSPSTLQSDITKDSDLISLDSFYYGMIPAEKVVDENDDGLLSMKCVICSQHYNDIIAMMKHLLSHAFHETPDKKDLGKSPMCRYCLRTFVTEYWLHCHLTETHLKNESGLMCCICEGKFKDRTALILHMHRSHVELELPYKCQICHFRTSQHTAMIDHFYDVHSKGKTVMCPFCLKTVALASNGKKITQNQYFFLNHIQKHKRKIIAKKCTKCVLWFVQKGILLEHQNSDHTSCKDLVNVQRFSAPENNGALMPRPKSSTLPSKSGDATLQNQPFSRDPVLNGNLFSKSSDLKAVKFRITEEGPVCSECESNLTEEDHFPGEFNCKKCKFVTNCYNAIIDHVTVFHDVRYTREPAAGKQVSGKPFIRFCGLNKPMYCCCGFGSSSGNKLAQHLVSCKKKSAYPSRVIANQNALAGLIPDLEDEDNPDDPDEIIEVDTPSTSATSFDLRSIRRGRTVID